MSVIPYPDTPQPDIPVPPHEWPTPVPETEPEPNEEPDLLPPEPSEPPEDDEPKIGLRGLLSKGDCQTCGERAISWL